MQLKRFTQSFVVEKDSEIKPPHGKYSTIKALFSRISCILPGFVLHKCRL